MTTHITISIPTSRVSAEILSQYADVQLTKIFLVGYDSLQLALSSSNLDNDDKVKEEELRCELADTYRQLEGCRREMEELRSRASLHNLFEENLKLYSEKLLLSNESHLKTIVAPRQLVDLGKMGEDHFEDIANTVFIDFAGYQLNKVSNNPQQGDFILNFDNFNILVDVKNYSNTVDNTSINKIKRDLASRGDDIRFAWLVSLKTDISNKNKAPIICEHIGDNKYLFYINSLLKHETKPLLKTLWHYCNQMTNTFIDCTGKDEIIAKLKKYQDLLKERSRLANELAVITKMLDEIVADVCNGSCTDNKHTDSVTKWLQSSYAYTVDDADVVKSTNVWLAFKKENAELAKELNVDAFREILFAYVPFELICNKNKKTFDIKCFKPMASINHKK